jgi:DNA-binding transcriptional LysR family regulator
MKKTAAGTTFMNGIHGLPMSEADARIFVAVAQAGSFVAAATLYGMTPSSVSKAIGRLEAGLGVRLLHRTTRKLQLTDEGAAFAERSGRAFALLAEAAEEAAAGSRSVAGVLRVGMPPLFGTHLVGPRLPALLLRHPDLKVEMKTLLRPADFLDANLDCAIAVGELPDSSLAARPLGYGRFVTVASPAYLQAAGRPAGIEDLRSHRRIGFTRADGREAPWMFEDGGGIREWEVQGQLRTDEMHHLAACAAGGLGIAQIPLFAIAAELADGRLVRLLESFEAPGKLASVVYPAARALPRRVRVFIDYMLELDGSSADLPGIVPASRSMS